MPRFRPLAVASATIASTLGLAALAPAADAPTPEPVVALSATVRPGRLPLAAGTPLTLTIDTRFASVPEGGNFVLQRATYLFGRGALMNGKLFPSCSVATLEAAHGRLGACPHGAQVGGGYAAGTAVAVGIRSRAKITVFNGPGGRSLTLNASIVNPVLINKTIASPIVRVHRGRYTMMLTSTLPEEFKRILDGDIVVSRLFVTTGATQIVDGVRRGYFEVKRCPRGGSPIHADFLFNQSRSASADFTVVC